MITIEERNRLATECIPMVKKIVKGLRIPKEYAEDCEQAGLVSVLEALPNWEPSATAWPAFQNGSLRLSVRRDVLRAYDTLRGAAADIALDDVWAVNDGQAKDDAGLGQSGAILTNDDNEDMEAHVQREQLLAAVNGLKDVRAGVLMLGILEGNTVDEMARRLGLTRMTAHRLYHKAVLELRTVMGNPDGE